MGNICTRTYVTYASAHVVLDVIFDTLENAVALYGTVISEGCKRRLDPGKYYNDTIMECEMTRLQYLTDRIMFFHGHDAVAILDMDTKYARQLTAVIIAGKPEFIVMLRNSNGPVPHYWCELYDIANKTATLYNTSLTYGQGGTSMSPCNIIGSLYSTEFIKYQGDCFQQTNGWDCGPLTLDVMGRFAYFIINKTISFIPHSSDPRETIKTAHHTHPHPLCTARKLMFNIPMFKRQCQRWEWADYIHTFVHIER
jgi:hypothetical protein